MTYAADTSVPVARSRAEIERLVGKAGGQDLVLGEDSKRWRALVGFQLGDRRLLFGRRRVGQHQHHGRAPPGVADWVAHGAASLADVELQAWTLGYVEGWWSRYVWARVPPPMDGSSQAGAWLGKRFPRDVAPVRAATPWEDARMLALQEAEGEASRWAGEVDTLRNELRQAMGEAGGLESPAGVVTWRADVRGRRTFRTKWRAGT